MTPGERQARELLKQMGLTCVDIQHNGRGHLRLLIRTGEGREFTTTFPNTPSEWRYLANQRSLIKRKVRQLDGNS